MGAAWQGRYDSLRLHTVRWLSGLPGAGIPRRYGQWVARDDLLAYLRDYAHRFGVHPEFGVEVTRLDRAGANWRVETSAGPRLASVVIVATGYSRTPHVPDWPGRDEFAGTLLHSTDYREPSPYRGRHVLVVGAGNSAAEIAVDLVGVGARVDLSVRTPPNIVRRDTLGVPSQLLGVALKRAPERVMNPLATVLRRLTVPDLSPYGLPAPTGDGFTQFLRTRTVPILDHGFVRAIRADQIRVVAAVDRFEAAEVRLGDGSTLHPGGMPPVHGANTPPKLPGLYVVGVTIGLAGLLREIGLEARAVGRALAERHVVA